MKRKAHRPPSKIRYDEAHPTVSIRVAKELYNELKEIKEKSGKSLGDILREALDKQAPSVNEAYLRGWDAAKRKYGVHYACSVCREDIIIEHKNTKVAIAKYMVEGGWGHRRCIDRTA